MVKSEATEERDATDTILNVILGIISVGEMTVTRKNACSALSKIQSDREDSIEKRKIVVATPERLRKSFAGVGASVVASNVMMRASFNGGGGGSGSPAVSPSKAAGLSVSAKTHSLDIVITEDRQRPEDQQVGSETC